MSFRGKGQLGSTLAFFLNLRVHQISTFFFSRHAFNFFFTRRDHKHKHALVVAFFHYFWKKAFTSTFAVFMTCDIFLYSFNIRRGCS